MRLLGTPDIWELDSNRGVEVAGVNWLRSLTSQWSLALENPEKRITIDMSNIEFVTLFEWVTTVALIERLLNNGLVSYINIDLVGSSKFQVLSPSKLIEYERGKRWPGQITESDIVLSRRVYRVAGFLESLGTRSGLDRINGYGQVTYPWIHTSHADLRAFYGHRPDRSTVLLGLSRISSKLDCQQFLDSDRIRDWRNEMEPKFEGSPVFGTDEIWRVICHELAVNIWEHSGAAGFLSARIVMPYQQDNQVRWWCKNTYDQTIGSVWPYFKDGFLEICIGDSGDGFIKTLHQVYLKRAGLSRIDDAKPEDVLSFAFDEFGTCKDEKEGWVTQRHALGRILFIVSKYGGALTLRSDGTDVIYLSTGSRFKRKADQLGFEPTSTRSLGHRIPGAQLQIILPLFPNVDLYEEKERPSVFESYLPESFRVDSSQAIGHLVPLLEATGQSEPGVGAKDQKRFRKSCEKLCEEILSSRPRSEPLVLDFSGLNWVPGQFETFLYLMQNVLHNRPILLVELDPELASEVMQLEEASAETLLDQAFVGDKSEKSFLETYSIIHATVLGVDRDGKKYIFGLSDHAYEEPVLSLIDNPRSIRDILQEGFYGEGVKESVFSSILTPINPLFWKDDHGLWHCVWEPQELAVQTSRVMSMHFDTLTRRTKAWWGRYQGRSLDFDSQSGESIISDPEYAKMKFNFSWQEEWRDSFLESSRFLSRERYSDEAAQRLIYRLGLGLELIGRSIEEVRVSACVTGPAMLLAAAIHRWWPRKTAPVVADLSYHVMLGKEPKLPAIVDIGGIVVVQDILEKHKVSGELIELLRQQSEDVICLISLIRLISDLAETQVTTISKGWNPIEEETSNFVPHHALIEVCSPKKCDAPLAHEDDSNLYWVEPRSLHPINYKTLRRDFDPGRDPGLSRRNDILPLFDDPANDCLLAAGHYVYGRRHYLIAIDVRNMLSGQIGEEIAYWISDICEGKKRGKPAEWEREEGFGLEGDVTVVLMPMYSQIHYLWPRISNLLAQRGRRQTKFLLDAALFTGREQTYRIPDQLEQQLESAVLDSIDAWKSGEIDKLARIRILILDDAIASARTAETILLSLNRSVRVAFRNAGENIEDCPVHCRPIQWIRYFAVLNQMGHAHYTLWHNLKYVGNMDVPFVLEEFAPFMGVPIYDEENCPYCRKQDRLEYLISKCAQHGANSAANYAKNYFDQLQPVAIDGPQFRKSKPVPLPSGIDVIGIKQKPISTQMKHIPQYADTGIWRFNKLMHLSYPLEDVLNSLDLVWPVGADADNDIELLNEYERYRWAVIDWCLNNWPRVKANTARRQFLECIKKEVAHNTSLVEKILEMCSLNITDEYITKFIAYCIDCLRQLERQRFEGKKVIDEDRIDRTERLETGLTLFFLNVVDSEKEGQQSSHFDKISIIANLIQLLEKAASELDNFGHSLLRILYSRVTRPKRIADSVWALNIVAEALLRGRDPTDAPAGRHKLLPSPSFLLSEAAFYFG